LITGLYINLSLAEEKQQVVQVTVPQLPLHTQDRGNSSDEEQGYASPRSSSPRESTKSPREGRLGQLSRNRRNSVIVSPRVEIPTTPRISPISQPSIPEFPVFIPSEPAWPVNFEELEFSTDKDQIGEGTSAKVYKGKYRGQEVAIKILDTQPDLVEFEKELAVLSSLRAPDIGKHEF
jgi:hypothetical protein